MLQNNNKNEIIFAAVRNISRFIARNLHIPPRACNTEQYVCNLNR